MNAKNRNAPCECGSGKKSKKCCRKNATDTNPSDVKNANPEGANLVFNGPLLMNRVERESASIAASFDAISAEAVTHLEIMYAKSAAIIATSLQTGNLNEMQRTSAVLLTNALKSLTAAFTLLRTGWRLQPYLCLRNGFEATSVVIHLIKHPNDLQKLKDGKLDVPKTLRAAKEAIPVLGQLYGLLTEEFVHIGKPFRHIQRGNIYESSEWEMWQCLASVSNFSLMIFIATELLFFERIKTHHCWRSVSEKEIQLDWSTELSTWRENFIQIYAKHLPKESVRSDN